MSIALVRKIILTEFIASDGTRTLSDISEAFSSFEGEALENVRALEIAQSVLGMDRELEKLPQADRLGRYPCPEVITRIFRQWPPKQFQYKQ